MPVYLQYLSISLSHPQGFQVVCEAAQSDSSSPTAGEQSCRRGNSVEKGGPSQQPPPDKGPSKKKWAPLINLTSSSGEMGSIRSCVHHWFLIWEFCSSVMPIHACCSAGGGRSVITILFLSKHVLISMVHLKGHLKLLTFLDFGNFCTVGIRNKPNNSGQVYSYSPNSQVSLYNLCKIGHQLSQP